MALPRIRDDLVVADFDTELVVLVPSTRRAHLLEPMMALVFDSCRSRHTFEALVGELSSASGESEQEMIRWVTGAVATLERAGVVTRDAG